MLAVTKHEMHLEERLLAQLVQDKWLIPSKLAGLGRRVLSAVSREA